MALRRPIPHLLALALTLASSASALDVTPRDLARLPEVEFLDLLDRPSSFSGRELKFRCAIAQQTDLYNELRSAFRHERYYALAVWDDRARLWDPEARAAVSTGLFLHKDRFSAGVLTKLSKYTIVEVAGIVKEVIDGEPQIEVLEVVPVSDSGSLTDQSIYLVERAQSLLADARELADASYQDALKAELPLAHRVDVLALRGRNLLAMGDAAKSKAVLAEAVALTRTDAGHSRVEFAQLLSLQAKALSEAQDHQESVASAREALTLDPSLGEAYAVLGIGLAGLQQYDEARRCCDNAVRLRPADAEVRWYLGRILTLQKRYDEAVESLKKAIDLTPKDHRIHLSIAEAYRGRGVQGGTMAGQDLVTALREVDIALRLKADQPEAQVLAGSILDVATAAKLEVLLPSGRTLATTALATERYQKALELAQGSVPALVAIGRLHVHEGREAEARKVIERLTALGATAEASALQTALAPAPAASTAVQATEVPAAATVVRIPAAEVPVVVPMPAAPVMVDPAPAPAPAAEQPAVPQVVPVVDAPAVIPAAP